MTGIKSLTEEETLWKRPNGPDVRQKPSLLPPEGYTAVYADDNICIETLLLGVASLGLMLVNVLSILVAGTIVLKVRHCI